ncbi:uncharacterized protein LOC120080187 isoform X2 [Benincasa hispida]|uniref:uncharacterized protein LOC120080187 isoform X2 n=1 Tax=Benincasa hispida TaxID=102211 RepID=UPI0019017F2F|nr:uncharacterized protein LOC120080187 isoform X2 [Benincasa hispida]
MMNEKLQSVAMSSEKGFQKSQVSASSNIRKKIDVLNRHENRDSKEQVLRDSKCNLRMSLAWDTAFFTSPGVLEPEELFTALNSRNYDNVVNILGNEEHLLLSSQSLEPDTNSKAENYNYRNSLAWDNGFFTSEGVLNPSELAIVNDGLKKSESHLVPVIEDEVWRSMESNNTFDSEGSSLTRLEMDLFEDIRASIPKPISSRFEPERPASAEPGGSRTMMKAKATCRKQSINKHGSKKIIKDIPKSPKVQLKHMNESREHHPSSSPKPFKASEQISKSSTKMASLGEKHVKLGCRSVASASAEGLGKLKKPCFRQSLNSIHSSIQSFRSSLSRYTTSKATRRPPSEITIRKSPPNFRRKVNSQGSNILVAGSSSVTPLMKKTKASKTAVESSFQSTPTSSWYGSPSPASSIDEWPLEFSSTSATQRCNRSKRSSYSSLRSSLIENENQESVVNRRHRKDHKKEGNADTSRILREVKPSGLRMPSPKHGFFDAENMLELATIADAKRDVVAHRIRCTNLQSPRTRLGTEIRIRKSGGTPVSISATKGNRSPTVKIYKKTGQCIQSMKAEKKIISQYTELDENKENEFSFVEGLAKQVKSIGLNNSDAIIRLSRRN